MGKEWYYRQGENQVGPITKEEISLLIGQGQLSLDDFVWKQGFPQWVKARDAQELFSNQTTPPPFSIPSVPPAIPEERRTGIRVAACLMFVVSTLWALITALQVFYAAVEESSSMAFDAAWNLIWTVASFAIGLGLWRQRHWAFRWGMTAAVIGVLWYGIAFFAGSTLMLFFAVIEVAVFILLFSNRRFFKEHEYLTS
jgi:uncharacterized membrane protein